MARLEIGAKTPLGSRLRDVRKTLGDIDRSVFAEKLNISKSGLAHYERGERSPDASVLLSYLTVFGIDINWLLTGKGEMFCGSNGKQDFVGHALLDERRLQTAIEAVEEGLQRTGHAVTAQRKAQLVLAAYELLESGGQKAMISRLINAL
ncbi:helix-turn-helix domain-containing protein [Bartonella sp. LJL80]